MSTAEAPVDTAATEPGTRSSGDKFIEIIAVMLLGLTTLGTAWCAYEATQWSGHSSDLSRQAAVQSVESSRLFGLATQTISYDSMSIAQYAQAVSAGNARLQEFYRTSLIRPALLPLIDAWEAKIRAGQAPVPLTEDKDYKATQLAGYEESLATGAELSAAAQSASSTASAYVSVTILLAVALFFSGVVPSFRYRTARALLLAASLATLALAASRLASLPVLF